MMKKAFTLIELLTVMAITAVMLTLIVLPIFQSFNILRTAQAFGDAQDKGRLLTERIAREVGNAVSVRDAAATVALLPDGKGGTSRVTLPYTKLDLIPPATGAPEDTLGPGVYRDPTTGKIDPTLSRPKGDVNLNVVPGATIVRWWVGLNRPADPTGKAFAYNEPYTGLMMPRNGDRDNLYVLRRAEVQPFIYRLRKDNQANSLAWRPNLAYFHSDDKVNDTQEFDTRIIDLDDPYFFVADGKYLPEGKTLYTDRMNDPDKNNRVLRWAGLSSLNSPFGRNTSSTAVLTEVSRYDMIRPLTTGSPATIIRDANGNPSIVPLVQFRPTRVASEPAAGSAAARPGEAVEGIDRIGPDTFRTSRGLWTAAIVRFYPGGYAPGPSGAAGAGLEIANVDTLGGVSIYRGVSDGSGLDMPATGANDALFDLKLYEQYLARGQSYPFTAAALNASAWYKDPVQRALFTPFRVLTATGKIVTSFSIEEVGDPTAAATASNLPSTTIANAMTPVEASAGDPTVATAPLSPAAGTYDINRAHNRLFLAYPDLQGDVQRYLDLRYVPQADGTLSPLCPTSDGGIDGFAVASNGTTVNRVRIVPGSDEVYGPSQRPGAAAGEIVRYTRVTGTPGPNQYRLVYADLQEPSDSTGTVSAASYQALLGLTDAQMNSGKGRFDPAVYDPTNVVSAAIQPRFKAGYMQFDSDPNVRMPNGTLTVKYRFQFNGPKDSFAVDLDTREVMQILLTIKNYPQSNAPNAQTITLKSTATLRNALR